MHPSSQYWPEKPQVIPSFKHLYSLIQTHAYFFYWDTPYSKFCVNNSQVSALCPFFRYKKKGEANKIIIERLRKKNPALVHISTGIMI